MDGHKRPDVVKYCNVVFLSLITSLKKQMVQWIQRGSKFKCIDLDLGPGERRVITLFQDKSSFHVNEFKKSTWYTPLVTLTGT
jgi:hypothetical protein